MFQSVERICVPSNGATRLRPRHARHVSIRRTDLCAFEQFAARLSGGQAGGFNPSNGFVCLRTQHGAREGGRAEYVSIRRTDLCAFELP